MSLQQNLETNEAELNFLRHQLDESKSEVTSSKQESIEWKTQVEV